MGTQAAVAGLAVEWDVARGVPLSVRGEDLGRRGAYSRGLGLAAAGRGDERDAIAVVDNLSGLFGVRDASSEFAERANRRDGHGRRHVRLAQRHRGLRVVGGELVVHFDKRGRAYEVNGTYVPAVAPASAPAVGAEQAVAAATAWQAARGVPAGTPRGSPELVVFARVQPARLAWQFERSVARPDGGAARWIFWVDAVDGSILTAFDNTQHIDAPTPNGSPAAISGQVLAGEGGGIAQVTGWFESANSQYYLHNTGTAWQIYNVATSGSYPDLNTYAHRGTTNWGASDPAEMSAASGFHLTQRYYAEVHGLFSFNDAGILARGNVHEGTAYVNAYWNGTDFHFGDGDGATANALAVLDVIGHEFTHAVTEYSANLVYLNEPGALNESFSDIFGACVEFFGQADDRGSYPARNAGLADWLLGEDCWLSSTALRDMRDPANPSTVGSGNEQPTRYLGTHWYTGSGDNGGVHYNSGVQNFFFYLLCEGGAGTNDGIAYNLTGIGIAAAEQVAFQALTAYCTPDTGYRAARSAWMSAALDVNPAWASNVAAAWTAVGVDAVSVSPPGPVGFQGEIGGPFSPAQVVLIVTNQDVAAAGWGVAHTQTWLSVSPASGLLAGLAGQAVTVAVNGAASALGVGVHADTLVFTNSVSSGLEQRAVTLTVMPPVIFTFPLDTDPGWTTEGQWAWGVPTGGGSYNRDPTSGYSGSHVYGYNLSGDYSNNAARYYLTSGPIDCGGLSQVQVSFWRWLGVENAIWDGAVFEASRDGVTWSSIWVHAGGSIADTSWTYQSFDLSAIADDEPTLYLRWGMGPSDAIITYPGWNLDDISVHGVAADILRVTPGGGLSVSGYFGGPFSPTGQACVIRNASTNGAELQWSASAAGGWLEVAPTGGTLSAGAAVTGLVWVGGAAATLPPGAHPGAVVFSNHASGFTSTRAWNLAVAEPLAVSPAAGWYPAGYVGGPFAPTSAVYTITNRGVQSVAWGVAHTQTWLTVSSADGVLAGGAATQVVAALDASAAALPAGVHGDLLRFTNAATARQETRDVQLHAVASPRMSVQPSALHVTNAMGAVSTSVLAVANAPEADADLAIEVRARETGGEWSAGFVAPAAPLRAMGPKPEPGHAFVPGELLVRFEDDVAPAEQAALLASAAGATAVRAYGLVPGLSRVRLAEGQSVEQALSLLANRAGIRYAQPNYLHRALDTTPNDPSFGDLWGLHNTGQTGGTPDADVDAPAAWDLATGDREVVVAIVDTGIDYEHEDLRSNLWVNAGETAGNGLDDDGNGFVDDVYGINAITGSGDPMDDHNHGTHCAGTVGAAGNNGVGVAGVNWRVRLMGCKFLNSGGSGSTADAITCIEYAALMGADVMNNSWGGGPFEQALQDAIEAANATGVTFVAAAGNDAMNTDVTPNYPSCYTSANVIAVMSVDHNDARSGFSNYGAVTVDLAAPGSSILSCRRGGGYMTMSGTSMATPHVAGACALLLAAHPGLSPASQRQLLMATVDHTVPGQCASGGRLNLARAVGAAMPAWLAVQPSQAAGVPPGGDVAVSVIFSAVDQLAGVYTGEVVVTGNDFGNPQVKVPAVMTVLADALHIGPAGTFESTGEEGGPFSPAGQTYTLSNAGPSEVTWTLAETSAWFEASATGGSLAAGATTSVTVSVAPSVTGLVAGTYASRLAFTNAANGVGQSRLCRLVVQPKLFDRFTEEFGSDNDLDFAMLTFTPIPNAPYYDVCRSPGVAAFPTDPTGGTALTLSDDDYEEVSLSGGASVPFFGASRTTLFIGSNGYLTFDAGDTSYVPSLAGHFSRARVAALYDDLNPSAGGTVSWKQLPDRVAVTWDGVPEYNTSNANRMQVELFTNGIVRVTWLGIAAQDGLAGLSDGQGLPANFAESDLTSYGACAAGPLLVVTNPAAPLLVPFTQETVRIEGYADMNALAGRLLWSNTWSGATGSTVLAASWGADGVPLAVGTNAIRFSATNDPRLVLEAADHGTNAAYADNWQDGDAGGSGWAAGGWDLLSWGGVAEHRITTNDPGNLSAGPRAFTLVASNGATAEARRELALPLAVGQNLRLRFDNNWIENGNSVGFGLQNAGGSNLFEFMFIGGASTYVINDSTNGRATSIPWSGDGWDLSFSLTAAGAYAFTCGAHTVRGQLMPAPDQTPVRLKFWNYSAGSTWQHNLYVNELRRWSALPDPIATSAVATIVRRPDPDSDHDGMDDEWETVNGLVVGTDDSAGNPDGDAWLNWQEYVADTPAQVSNAALRVDVQLAPDGVRVVAGPSTTNSRRYDLHASTNLPAGGWFLVESNVSGAADGGPLALPATNAPPARALRVGVHLP